MVLGLTNIHVKSSQSKDLTETYVLKQDNRKNDSKISQEKWNKNILYSSTKLKGNTNAVVIAKKKMSAYKRCVP